VLELGCGKGEYTIALAERDPGRNYIGVDIKGARMWKGAKYATEHALPNVAFLRTRVEFITAFFAPGEVSEVWLTFSDPQYRSENSRLCSPLFLERYRSFMKPGGVVHLKTDSRFLHEYARAVCEVNGLQILACTTDLYGIADAESAAAAVPPADRSHPRLRKREGPASEGSGRSPAEPDVCRGELPDSSASSVQPVVREVQTFYEQLFLEQGYPITYLSFVIDHDGPFHSPVEAGTFDADYWRSVEGPRLLFGHDSAETRRQKIHAAESAGKKQKR
jgi:Predicted S-adenosylmethionine-dependent methyltransferase